MKQLSVFLWVVFGVIVGYQLKPPKTIQVPVEVPVAGPVQVQTIVRTEYKPIPQKCDYGAYEQTIANLQEQLEKIPTEEVREIVVPINIPRKIIVAKKREPSFTLLFSAGQGVNSVDIKTSPDGATVWGEPKKGFVGGISGYYKFKPFEVFSVPVDGLTVGGGIIGAETQFFSIGYTW